MRYTIEETTMAEKKKNNREREKRKKKVKKKKKGELGTCMDTCTYVIMYICTRIHRSNNVSTSIILYSYGTDRRRVHGAAHPWNLVLAIFRFTHLSLRQKADDIYTMRVRFAPKFTPSNDQWEAFGLLFPQNENVDDGDGVVLVLPCFCTYRHTYT